MTKTTIGGLIAAIGNAIVAYSTQVDNSGLFLLIGSVTASVGAYVIGKYAADVKGGIKPPPPPKP